MATVASFEASWAFTSAIKSELKADAYEIQATGQKFSSGRPKFKAVFYKGYGDNRKIITERDAMELLSKRTGTSYFVVSRSSQKVATHAAADASTGDFDDVFE